LATSKVAGQATQTSTNLPPDVRAAMAEAGVTVTPGTQAASSPSVATIRAGAPAVFTVSTANSLPSR